MTEESGRPGAPVFVDNSGGRRRTWRRLGMSMGVAGGGYALAVAVSVIGGNAHAPWVLIPGGAGGKSDSVRVVPRPAEDRPGDLPAVKDEAGAGGQPSAEASASASSPNRAATTGSSDGAPGSQESAGTQAMAKPAGDRGDGRTGGGSAGGRGGAPSAPSEPTGTGEPTQGTGSSTSSGASAGQDQDPEPTPSPSESGLLDGVLDQLGGVFGAGAE